MGRSDIVSEGWEGLGFHLKTSFCLGLLKSMGFGFEAWPTKGSTSITLDQLIPHLP